MARYFTFRDGRMIEVKSHDCTKCRYNTMDRNQKNWPPVVFCEIRNQVIVMWNNTTPCDYFEEVE